MRRAFLGMASLIFPAALAAQTVPPIGQLCPPGFHYDSENCLLSGPKATAPAVDGTRFVASPPCPPKFALVGEKCHLEAPAGYLPFVHEGGFYVTPNAHFVRQDAEPRCPPRGTYDGKACFFGSAPANTKVLIAEGRFAFTKPPQQSCASLRKGAAPMSLNRCSVGPVPTGFMPFINDNSWYTIPARKWLVRDYLYEPEQYWHSTCRTDDVIRQWKLVWSDEFDEPPDGKRCYTSNDLLRCVRRPYLYADTCVGSPAAWNTSSVAAWSATQAAQFSGLRALDKCTWSVYDTFNTWDAWGKPPLPNHQRTNSLRPENIRIENGILKMRTNHHPTPNEADGYCCGTKIPIDSTQVDYTKDCPYSGALMISETALLHKRVREHDRNHPDPAKRYVGRTVAFGRVEFRARITKLGHGAWPALWLFTDRAEEGVQQAGEIDVLEYVADRYGDTPLREQSLSRQIRLQSSAYGMAGQTAHHYVGDAAKTTYAKGVSVPIGVGEWHVYAVEWEPSEIRFYTDSCLTERIVEGQQVSNPSNPASHGTFRVPVKQSMAIMIGNPASASRYKPEWYRTLGKQTDLCGTGDPNCEEAEPFEPTEFEVDYVRVYVDTKLPQQLPDSWVPIRAPLVTPDRRPWATIPTGTIQR